MRGPWARAFAAAVGGESDLPVEAFRVEPGAIFGEVDGCRVALLAPLVSEGVWTAVVRFARHRGSLQLAVAGGMQSETLAHMLAEDWEEPLVPPAEAIARICECDDGGACEHVLALARAAADAIDESPRVLLAWRGCADPPVPPADPWRGAELPELAEARPWPPGTILMRLGASGITVAGTDVVARLESAYRTFPEPR